jgi:hypothetical protein
MAALLVLLEEKMKWVLNIIGVLLILVGIVWILQGINILPGSIMSGQIQYTYYGLILDLVGIALLVVANRRSKAADEKKRP